MNDTRIEKKAPARINTNYLALTAAFVALTFVVTFFINIPTPVIFGAGGNINLGDCVIFVAAVILGPLGGAIAGGVGAAAADIAGGYLLYAPFTLVIKAAAGFLCGFFSNKIFSKKQPFLNWIFSISIAALVIVAGYFFAEMVIIGAGFFESDAPVFLAGLRTLLPNLIQVSLSVAVAIAALPKLPKVHLFKSV